MINTSPFNNIIFHNVNDDYMLNIIDRRVGRKSVSAAVWEQCGRSVEGVWEGTRSPVSSTSVPQETQATAAAPSGLAIPRSSSACPCPPPTCHRRLGLLSIGRSAHLLFGVLCTPHPTPRAPSPPSAHGLRLLAALLAYSRNHRAAASAQHHPGQADG